MTVIVGVVTTEADQLADFLDRQREILLRKTAGLTAEQLRTPHPPSTLTLAGLLNHGALNEHWWFGVRLAGEAPQEPWAGVDFDADPEWEMREALTLEPEELRRRYAEACERSREIVRALDARDGLDTVAAARSGQGEVFDARWVVLHMIEETARHAGHADLIRESIDGEVGE